jgi:hypothetical protein
LLVKFEIITNLKLSFWKDHNTSNLLKIFKNFDFSIIVVATAAIVLRYINFLNITAEEKLKKDWSLLSFDIHCIIITSIVVAKKEDFVITVKLELNLSSYFDVVITNTNKSIAITTIIISSFSIIIAIVIDSISH